MTSFAATRRAHARLAAILEEERVKKSLQSRLARALAVDGSQFRRELPISVFAAVERSRPVSSLRARAVSSDHLGFDARGGEAWRESEPTSQGGSVVGRAGECFEGPDMAERFAQQRIRASCARLTRH